MPRKQRKVALLFFLFLALWGRAWAVGIPERLVFDLTWTGVKAGTATLEIMNERDSVRIVSTARSADWLSVFYEVDDRVESVLSGGEAAPFPGKARTYRVRLREGRHRRDKEVVFEHEKGRVSYIDHLRKSRRIYPIGNGTFDPLSSFYHIRSLPLEVGRSLYVDIFDSKKMWHVEVQILRRERIRTSLGEFNTIVIKPLMQSEGIFNRKGEIEIWLTDDTKRVPVKMQTKAAVGSIIATLVGGSF